MRFDISYILYGMAVVLAAASLMVFGFDVLMSLSPTIRSLLLLLTFTFFVAAGNYTSEKGIRNIFYLIAAFAYGIFLLYTFAVFNLSSEAVFLMLAVSSIMFMGFGYMAKQRETLLEAEIAKLVMIMTIILTVIVLVGDLAGAQPTMETTYVDRIDVTEQQQQVGTLTLTNPFIVSREVEPQFPQGCLVAAEGRIEGVPMDLERRPSLLAGGETEVINMTVRIPYEQGADEQEFAWLGNYSHVRVDTSQDSCPSDAETATLFITGENDRSRTFID